MKRTAIVIGATGLVGRALVERLARTDHFREVVTLTRREAFHGSSRVRNRVVDFADRESLSSALHGDCLFSALGATRREAGSIEAQRRVDVDYQLAAAAAEAAAANGVGHLLLVSSSLANARSANAYLRMKGELEAAVVDLAFARVSIFRPFILIGRRERQRPLEQAGATAFEALARLPGMSRFRPVPADTLAAKMVRVSAAPGAARQWFASSKTFGP